MLKNLHVLLVSLAVVLPSSVAAAAEGTGYVGVGTSIKGDGRNPLDGSGPLMYVPAQLELGWAVRPDTEIHIGGAYGETISLAEGGGHFAEVTAGLRLSFLERERWRLAVDLSVGWSRSAFENKQTVATTDGLIAEPSLQFEVDLTSSLSLALGLLARAEVLVGDVRIDEQFFGGQDSTSPASESRGHLQRGAGTSALLRYRF